MDLIGENLLASLSLRTKTSYHEYLRYLFAAAKCVFVVLMFVGANVGARSLVNLNSLAYGHSVVGHREMYI